MNIASGIANTSQVRRLCDGCVIANGIANGSQNVASNRHSVRCSVSSLVETSPSIVTSLTREAHDAMDGATRFNGGQR